MPRQLILILSNLTHDWYQRDTSDRQSYHCVFRTGIDFVRTITASTSPPACCRSCGYSAVCRPAALINRHTSCDQTRPRRLPLARFMFLFSSSPLLYLLAHLAPPCPPPNTPPHAPRRARPCCSTPCAIARLPVYNCMVCASSHSPIPRVWPSCQSTAQSFAHTLRTHSSPRLSRALSIVPFTCPTPLLRRCTTLRTLLL